MLRNTTDEQRATYKINGGMSHKLDGVEIYRPSEILKLIANRSKSYETDNIKDILDNYDALSQQEDAPERFQEHLNDNVQTFLKEKSKILEGKSDEEKAKLTSELDVHLRTMGFYSQCINNFFGKESGKINFNVITLENIHLELVPEQMFKNKFGDLYNVKIADNFDNLLIGHIHLDYLIDTSEFRARENLAKTVGSNPLSRFDITCAALTKPFGAEEFYERVLIYNVYNHNGGQNKKERIGNPILECVM